MMRHVFLALAAALLLPASAQAQQLIGSYFAVLDDQDRFSSSGARLTDFGAILQQDRANFHRFGLRNELDQPDPVFASRENRALIPAIWRIGPGPETTPIPGHVAGGGTSYVYVEIYGVGTTPQFMIVHQGAG